MRVLLLCCLTILPGFETLGAVPPQKALPHLSQPSQSQDVSLLKPTDVAYDDAMVFARFLEERSIKVKSVHGSTLNGFFRGIGKAAFFRTDKGIVQVIFFPDPIGAEKIQVTEQRRVGRYRYSFKGQPHPNPPGDTFDSERPMYFLMHRNWFMVPESKKVYDALKGALKED